jgi:hypothetical protein
LRKQTKSQRFGFSSNERPQRKRSAGEAALHPQPFAYAAGVQASNQSTGLICRAAPVSLHPYADSACRGRVRDFHRVTGAMNSPAANRLSLLSLRTEIARGAKVGDFLDTRPVGTIGKAHGLAADEHGGEAVVPGSPPAACRLRAVVIGPVEGFEAVGNHIDVEL